MKRLLCITMLLWLCITGCSSVQSSIPLPPNPTPEATHQLPTPTASPADDGTYQSFLHIFFTEYFNAYFVTLKVPDNLSKFEDNDSSYVFRQWLVRHLKVVHDSNGQYPMYDGIIVKTEIRNEMLDGQHITCQVYVKVDDINVTMGCGLMYDIEISKTEDSFVITKIAGRSEEYECFTSQVLSSRDKDN